MKEESLNHADFERGVKFWKKTYWPRDFHNSFYVELERINTKDQFSPQWWNAILPHLKYWKATRPYKAKDLTKRAIKRLGQLKKAWKAVDKSPCTIAKDGLRWEHLQPFAKIVAEIKKTKSKSPVFLSKMCHFISPSRFPVIDKTAMEKINFKTYEDYWKYAKKIWAKTSNVTQQELEQLLMAEVKKSLGDKLIPNYPYACKLTEICLIGRAKRR